MTLPKPPANGFSAKENPGALIALKALRYDAQGPDPFGKSESGFAETTYLDVWVLADSREVGAFYSNVPNSSRLGRQFKNNLGEMFYGRIESEKVGAGTSYILAEPYPSDQPLIAVHRAQIAAEQAPAQQGASGYTQPRYQNEPAWQDSPPAPQGQPVIAQAGGSPRGRKFAAAHADTIVVNAKGIEAMRAYRDDVHKHMVAQGRKPSDCKVLYLINPILGETMEEALERKRKRACLAMEHIDERLAHFGKVTNIDFAKFDLDKPLPDHVTTNGHQLNLEQFRKMANGRSIRETMASFNAVDLSVELVGTPDAVAARMGEVMQEVGGDGFLFSMPNVSRRTLAEIEDGLIPALQDRGLMRKTYEHAQFRDNLLAF